MPDANFSICRSFEELLWLLVEGVSVEAGAGCGVRCLWVGVMLGFLGSQSFRFKGGRSMYVPV
jgi:hypothetical protein